MKKVLFGLMVIVPMIFMVMVSCKKDKTSPKKLSEEIQNIVPDTILDKITTLGMKINKGLEPPDIGNSYLASPFELTATNIPDDYSIGHNFSDYYFRLYDQDNEDLTIRLDYSNGGETGTGLGGFISGDGNKFSVFVVVNSEYNGYPAELIHIITGTITDEGIENLYFANFMLDNFDNEGGYWIENGEGRVIIDSDSMSPITPYDFKSTERAATTNISSAGRRK
jgi:hypothetical protein